MRLLAALYVLAFLASISSAVLLALGYDIALIGPAMVTVELVILAMILQIDIKPEV